MIRIIDFRVIIEKYDTHEKYYPKVISFNTIDDSPLSEPPSAAITMFAPSNLNNVATVSQIESYDIIRLQVSIRYSSLENCVWADLFEGRVQNQSKNFSTNNEIELSCIGHIVEAKTAMFLADKIWKNQDATAILSDVCSSRLSKIQYSSNYAKTGLIVEEYNVVAQQNFVIDVFEEMETLSGNKRMIGLKPVYSSNGNLQTCYLTWNLLSSVPTPQYAVIEGTPRLISATFDIIGEEIYTFRYVKGGTDSSGNQYFGSAGYPDSKYGARYKVDAFTWIKSSVLCVAIAGGLLSDSKAPYVAGSVVLEGTPDAHVGDLVTVFIPSLEVRGSQINGTYTVYRVSHTLSADGFKTTLDLGRIKKNAYDYIAKNITKTVKTAYKNQAK